ncbi:F-box domain-containing protein [Heracleum sosnowskyi]|uniref:F-box domain-containing protein n=1 Tax=Heracleum sosnowskyi TaxID=360622 RepID=A0AAD8MGT5_9APIA|nr:F-box domain-containing protein [Heracleum sosnowskyi]
MQKKKRKYIDLNEDYRSPSDDINDDRVDLLSNLPDHLLIHILSLVDIKTARRTSILSKRWTGLWTDLMDLDFDDFETTATIEYKSYAQPEMDKFVVWVNHIIASNRAPYLGTFRIHFPLNGLYAAHMENWLKFAFVKKVRNLELNFYNLQLNFVYSYSRNIHFQKSFLNTTLESLHLKSVSVERHFLQWVITNCLNLQNLSFHHCDDASSKHRLKIVISSLKLKNLEFFKCLKLLKIDALHLSAPNLTSFIYNESELDVKYRSVPSLVNVTFGGSYCHHLKALSGFSSQLEKLSIVWDDGTNYANRDPSRSWFNSVPINSRFPTFVNVQQLEITSSQKDVYLLSVMSLIEACPLMHTFKLKLMCRKQREGPRSSLAANKTQFKIIWHLKTVEYLGYTGCSFASELALCLTRLAPMLRRFIFDTRQPQFVGKAM